MLTLFGGRLRYYTVHAMGRLANRSSGGLPIGKCCFMSVSSLLGGTCKKSQPLNCADRSFGKEDLHPLK
jgi:hypothetical protein